MSRVIKALVTAAILGTGFGCSTTEVQNEGMSPTHRWVSEKSITESRYSLHNQHCAQEALAEIGTERKRELDGRQVFPTAADAEFIAYERCMEEKGYTLATY